MSTTRDEHIARAVALKAAVEFAGTQAVGAQTAADVVLNAEFFLTFLEPSEPTLEDGDPGPEVPFE